MAKNPIRFWVGFAVSWLYHALVAKPCPAGKQELGPLCNGRKIICDLPISCGLRCCVVWMHFFPRLNSIHASIALALLMCGYQATEIGTMRGGSQCNARQGRQCPA
ncbi:hypothetical protein BDA96_03G406600 [Sorghum bicolor]|uniref:Secreted protein n=1 Tax=Sorghum bicolor TaxID=4558 RepID=A0A921RJ85_SORBI|nr:hypothetical protein BDA96_03G406600 [Sorghum bicolor]